MDEGRYYVVRTSAGTFAGRARGPEPYVLDPAVELVRGATQSGVVDLAVPLPGRMVQAEFPAVAFEIEEAQFRRWHESVGGSEPSGGGILS